MALRQWRGGPHRDSWQGPRYETNERDRDLCARTPMQLLLSRHLQFPGAPVLRKAGLQGLRHAGRSSQGAYSLLLEKDSGGLALTTWIRLAVLLLGDSATPVIAPTAVVGRVFLAPSLALGEIPRFVGEGRLGEHTRPIDFSILRVDMALDIGEHTAVGISRPDLDVGMPGTALLEAFPGALFAVVGELRLIDKSLADFHDIDRASVVMKNRTLSRCGRG